MPGTGGKQTDKTERERRRNRADQLAKTVKSSGNKSTITNRLYEKYRDELEAERNKGNSYVHEDDESPDGKTTKGAITEKDHSD